MSNPFHDPGAAKLLSRVREDISHLRGDMTKLLTYTTRYTLPKGAREIAGNARQGLVASRSYATKQLRALGTSPPRQVLGVLAGAAIVGLLAVAVYAVCQNDSRRRAELEADDEDISI